MNWQPIVANENEVAERVLRLVARHARFVEPGGEPDPDRPLRELGVDSFGLVDLLAMVEDEFGIVITDDQLVPETFRSAASLAATVVGLLKSPRNR